MQLLDATASCVDIGKTKRVATDRMYREKAKFGSESRLVSRDLIRCGLCILVSMLTGFAIIGFSHIGTAAAQEAGTSRDDATKRLKQTQSDLQRARERVQKIESDVDGLTAERSQINTRLLETSRSVQQTEGRMTFLENRIQKLSNDRDDLRVRLSAQNSQIMKLLGAMQRMGRDPPPVIITQRADALRMVRSAMLLAKAFPELKVQAEAITAQLMSLSKIMAEHKTESERLRAEAIRLSDAQTELEALLETKRQSLLDRQKELQELRGTSERLSRNVTDLRELIAKLDTAVSQTTRLGEYNRKTPAESPGRSALTGRPPLPGSPDAVEIAPNAGTQVANAARLEPAVPFYKATASLPLPAVGEQLIGFGERTQYGAASQGLVIKTRHSARIVSPSDGWVVYAGEFRSYGQLLIINAGAGYHILLAGLTRIDVQLGQFVLTGEPVGSMPSPSWDGAGDNAPVLYVEFRNKGKPIDPSPWWASGQQKVQG